MAEGYNLRYTGEEVDELLETVEDLGYASSQAGGLMSASDKAKLDGIEQGAQVNVIENVQLNGLNPTKTGKTLNFTLDSTPVQGSVNGVSSGGVFAAMVAAAQERIAAENTLQANINSVIASLANYYLKSETYSQQEVNNLIGAINQFKYEIYQTLPPVGVGNVLYLIGPTGSGSDKYEEYVYANNTWTKIGDTTLDLSGYSTTEEMNAAISAAIAAAMAAISEDLDKKANKDGWYQTLTSGLSENLVDTKGAGTEQEFTDRTSCGAESIADDGSGIIKELRGNSLAFNQLCKLKASSASTTINGITVVDNRDGSFTVSTTPEGATADTNFNAVTMGFVLGHKYFMRGCPSGGSASTFMLRVTTTYASGGAADVGGGIIFAAITNVGSVNIPQIRVINGTVITTPITFWPQVTDLTRMFGQGNEPATVEEFVALYRAKYYPQADGTILNNAAATLVTDGFNQWDEEWEAGTISTSTGANGTSSNAIRSKNYYPIAQGATYYIALSSRISASGSFVYFYDGAKNYLGYISRKNNTFTPPVGAAYFRLRVGDSANPVTTYQNDICVNLSWSGYRNGEYEPYWKRVTGVDMRKIYGKLNGTGEMVQVFPDGGRSAGDAYDVAEIFEKKEADVRLGVVDLGTLAYSEGTTGEAPIFTVSYTQLTNRKVGSANLLCPRYIAVGGTRTALQNADKAIASYSGASSAISIRDDAYTTGADIKAALNGVPLVYELAEPLHYTDLMYSEDGGQTFVDIPTVSKVADFGTERIEPLVDAQGNPVTAPFRAVIKYSDDFTRTIVNLPKNFDTTGGLDDLLAALSSVLGTALNGTLSIARGAYNPATKKYAWSVSFTPNNE